MDTNRLLAKLTDPDEDVRAYAREELSVRMDDDIARAFLDVASSDAAEEIRADVIVGLGPVIEEASMDFDEEAPLDDLGEEEEEIEGLGPRISLETFEAIKQEIRAIYEDEAQPKLVRRRALEVLVRDPQAWHSGEIRKLMATGDRSWKMTAIFAMGHVPGFERELASLVRTEKDPLLYEAVRASGRMEVAEAADRIREIALSESAETELRLAAIEALPGVDRDCEETLQELIESEEEEIAAAAEDALDELALGIGMDALDDDFDDFDDEELEDEDEKE